MNNDNKLNSVELSEQELTAVAGGTTEKFDLDEAIKKNEEWRQDTGIQTFGVTGNRLG